MYCVQLYYLFTTERERDVQIMTELSLSNSLLDGIILTHTIHPDEDGDDNHEPTEPEYPALVYSDPYKTLNQTILFKPPSKKPTKTALDTDQSVTSSPPRCLVHGIQKKIMG